MKVYNSIDDITPRSLARFKARIFNQAMPIASAYRLLIHENDKERTGDWKTGFYFDAFRDIYPDAPLNEFVGGFNESGFPGEGSDEAFNTFIAKLVEQIKEDSRSF